jgi:outer membrane lipoprotein LolB
VIRWHRLSAAAVAAALASCASAPPELLPMVAGRLSIQVAAVGDQAARGMNAGFELRGSAETGELRLSSMLGPQIASASWQPGRVRLSTGDGQTDYPDLDSLARDALGEPLPLKALPDWLAARPWPGAASQAAASGFAQLGWVVDLTRRAEGFVIATRSTPPTVILRVHMEPR